MRNVVRRGGDRRIEEGGVAEHWRFGDASRTVATARTRVDPAGQHGRSSVRNAFAASPLAPVGFTGRLRPSRNCSIALRLSPVGNCFENAIKTTALVRTRLYIDAHRREERTIDYAVAACVYYRIVASLFSALGRQLSYLVSPDS